MADEVTYSGISGNYTQTYRLLADSLVESLYENAQNILPFLIRKSIAGFISDSERFPKAPALAAAALTDGNDLANTAYVPTQITLTVAEVGLAMTLTDLANFSSITDIQQLGFEAGQAVADKLITDIAALGSGFTNTQGSTGVDLTEQQLRDAKTTLIINKIPGPYATLLYPTQVNDLEGSIGSTLSAAATTGTSARAETNDMSMGPSMDHGTWFGIRILSSSTVPTAAAGADSAGFIFGGGRALGYVEKWAIRPELERDASLRASEVVVTAAYAVGEIDDLSGVGLITDR